MAEDKKIGKDVGEIVGTKAVVNTILVTASGKVSIDGEIGAPYSNVLPSFTQVPVDVQIELNVPLDWKPGDEMTLQQEKLRRVAEFVSQPLDEAIANRLVKIGQMVAIAKAKAEAQSEELL